MEDAGILSVERIAAIQSESNCISTLLFSAMFMHVAAYLLDQMWAQIIGVSKVWVQIVCRTFAEVVSS